MVPRQQSGVELKSLHQRASVELKWLAFCQRANVELKRRAFQSSHPLIYFLSNGWMVDRTQRKLELLGDGKKCCVLPFWTIFDTIGYYYYR